MEKEVGEAIGLHRVVMKQLRAGTETLVRLLDEMMLRDEKLEKRITAVEQHIAER